MCVGTSNIDRSRDIRYRLSGKHGRINVCTCKVMHLMAVKNLCVDSFGDIEVSSGLSAKRNR
jgi:hypothetical protein